MLSLNLLPKKSLTYTRKSKIFAHVKSKFGNNTIKCKKLPTIVSGRKNIARPFFRQKQVSTSAEM